MFLGECLGNENISVVLKFLFSKLKLDELFLNWLFMVES